MNRTVFTLYRRRLETMTLELQKVEAATDRLSFQLSSEDPLSQLNSDEPLSQLNSDEPLSQLNSDEPSSQLSSNDFFSRLRSDDQILPELKTDPVNAEKPQDLTDKPARCVGVPTGKAYSIFNFLQPNPEPIIPSL